LPHLFIFGLGYSAGFLARHLRDQGWEVSGTCRDPDQAARLTAGGIRALVFDRDHPIPDSGLMLNGVSHVLSSVPPDAQGDPVFDMHRGTLADHARKLEWAGYLSTIGVYGDRQGGWVDETSALDPASERGHRRVRAERDWLSLGEDENLPVHIFRLAGIYGPGSNVLDKLRAGTARRIVKEGQVFSRIHVDDIVQVLATSMAKPRGGAIYNVCDDEAAPPQDVVAHGAGLLGIAPPPEVPIADAGLSPMGLSFYGESKRVRNDLIKKELGVTLKYPTYRDGLAALIEAST